MPHLPTQVPWNPSAVSGLGPRWSESLPPHAAASRIREIDLDRNADTRGSPMSDGETEGQAMFHVTPSWRPAAHLVAASYQSAFPYPDLMRVGLEQCLEI